MGQVKTKIKNTMCGPGGNTQGSPSNSSDADDSDIDLASNLPLQGEVDPKASTPEEADNRTGLSSNAILPTDTLTRLNNNLSYASLHSQSLRHSYGHHVGHHVR